MNAPISHSRFAAIDLGSNSFRMVVARELDQQLQVVDHAKETVRLGAGLSAKGVLDRGSQERALTCLQRFAKALVGMPPEHVRAVGTNALRRATNASAFVQRASDVLGHEIEVVSGVEEARLIYLGAAHCLAGAGRRLVIDIGGGSTECMLGEGFRLDRADSLHMGCVEWTRRFFPDGRLSKKRLRRAVLAARVELEPLAHDYRLRGWQHCVGCSGSIVSVAEVVQATGGGGDRIGGRDLAKLRKRVLALECSADLEQLGFKPERAQVLPGGLAILLALFEELAIEQLQCSAGALREGVLYDLFGRLQHADPREGSIRELANRYHIDTAQARRVRLTAGSLLEQISDTWQLGRIDDLMLGWAARLHELGLAVAYPGHHRHGAYIIENSVLPGFSRDEQQLLAVLVGGHRRKLREGLFTKLRGAVRTRATQLVVILRLAVLLNRSRSSDPLPTIEARAEGALVSLALPAVWIEDHPLVYVDLELESAWLGRLGFELQLERMESPWAKKSK